MANKPRKRYRTSLVIRQMQIKITRRYHYTSIKTATIKKTRVYSTDTDMEQRELLAIVGSNPKWHSHLGEQLSNFLYS